MKKSVFVIVIIIVVGIIGLIFFTNNTSDNPVAERPTTMHAIFTTNKGIIKLELYGEKTPKTVENFTKLAKEGFYNETKFHRVIEDFMIQGGDPQSREDELQDVWGTGGPGYMFEDEIVPGLSNVTGTISMANAGPNTNGSQFFINVADNVFLDGKHAVFGKVVEGMDVVTAISELPRNDRDVPNEPVIIQSIVIEG